MRLYCCKGINKGAKLKPITATLIIQKRDFLNFRIFGYVCPEAIPDEIAKSEIEDIVYCFMENLEGSQDNEPIGIIESLVITEEKRKAMGISSDSDILFNKLPEGIYWIGFEVRDPALWDELSVKDYHVLVVNIAINENQDDKNLDQ